MKTGSATAMFDLTGKVIVVTGAAGILGGHFSRALAGSGGTLALLDQQRLEVEELAKSIALEFGVDAIGLHCDVTDPKSVIQAVDQVEDRFGHIDVLHNNAATKGKDPRAFFDPFEDFSLRTWREIMSVNIDGMFLMAQAVGRKMKARGNGGSIIQTASIYGVVAPDQRIYEGSNYLGGTINTPAVYSTSKAAVIGLSQHLSTYWGPLGIRVNTLTPGGVQSGQNGEFVRKYSERVPLGRMATPDDLSGALVYLASDASRYVTGQNLVVDGGFTVW